MAKFARMTQAQIDAEIERINSQFDADGCADATQPLNIPTFIKAVRGFGVVKDEADDYTETPTAKSEIKGYDDLRRVRTAKQLMSRPVPTLTVQGLQLLAEIWSESGEWQEGKMYPVDNFVTSYRPSKALGKIRSHLMKGGYLIVAECQMIDDTWKISEIGLSKKGYDAVMADRKADRETGSEKAKNYVDDMIEFLGY